MKRALTGIAAAAAVLSTAAPMAFAATTSSSFTNAGQVNFSYNGTTVSSPYILDGQDSGNTTAFAPIYYFDNLLKQAGITATWNGNTHTWALSSSSIDASKVNVAGGVGTGNTTITLNGTTIKKINTAAAQDPAAKAGQMTTYFPVYYVQTLFQAVGINATWNGTSGLAVSSTATAAATASLSAPTITGQTVGTGSQTSPAIVTKSTVTPVTVATTLTDANGNPIPNASLSLTLTGTVQPTVGQGSTYETIGGSAADGWTASVTTDATGTATFTVSGIGGYTLAIAAPYSNNGTQVSQTVYLGFVNSATLLTPGSTSNAYSTDISSATNATAGLVPVTVTLPLNSSGDVQSDAQVNFTFSSNPNGAFFATSTGSSLGSSVTAYTNSQGQATVYVNAYEVGTAQVKAQLPSATGGNGLTDIEWNDPNATSASTAAAFGVSAFQPNTTTPPTTTSLTGLTGGSSVYVSPLNSSNALWAPSSGDSVTYTLSASNSGYISNIDGAAIPSVLGDPTSVQLTITNNGGTFAYTVDGVPLTGYAASFDTAEYFSVALADSSTGASTLTVSNASANATAAFSFTSSQSYAESFSPASSNLGTFGGSENITYTVVDSSGNPVENQATTLNFDNNLKGLYITAVNGTVLEQNLGSDGAAVYTPIPLYDASGVTYGVSVPNVVSWSGVNSNPTDTLTVFTNASGQVQLTVQNGNVNYWNSGASKVEQDGNELNLISTHGAVYADTYVDNAGAASNGAIWLSDTANNAGAYTSNNTQVGEIDW